MIKKFFLISTLFFVASPLYAVKKPANKRVKNQQKRINIKKAHNKKRKKLKKRKGKETIILNEKLQNITPNVQVGMLFYARKYASVIGLLAGTATAHTINLKKNSLEYWVNLYAQSICGLALSMKAHPSNFPLTQWNQLIFTRSKALTRSQLQKQNGKIVDFIKKHPQMFVDENTKTLVKKLDKEARFL